MPCRETVMKEASELLEARYKPRADYCEYGWMGFFALAGVGLLVAIICASEGLYVLAWYSGMHLGMLGLAILTYSKHPIGSYERADIDIQWPTTYRGYGSLFHVNEELSLLMILVIYIVTMVLIRFT